VNAAMNGDPARRVLVLGASGVVGSVLCRLMVQEGWSVVGTTRTRGKDALLRAIGVEPVVLDAFDADAVRECVIAARASVVVHQLTDLPVGFDAKRHPDALARNARIREEGTRNLVAAAADSGVTRIVAQSIAFAYAPGATPFTEASPLVDENDPTPLGVTVRGVLALERQVLGGPFAGIVLRYGRFYGPGTGVEAPPSRGPVHVDAAADAARRAVTRGHAGVYNIADADGTVDASKARRELGWQPSFRMASGSAGP